MNKEEQVQAIYDLKVGYTLGHADVAILKSMASMLLAGMEQEPVVVPDGVSGPLAHAYRELTPQFMHNHISVFERYGIYPDGSASIQAMRIALDGMERRAATLQLSGNSEHVGWIKCSERNPEESGRYWCHIEEQSDLGKSHYQWNCSWNDDGWWIESENGGRVTHWMPLPVAPKP